MKKKYKPLRCVYVIFFRSGEIYAGKYFNFNGMGKHYFGSSGIAKHHNLQIAHIVKFAIPENYTEEQYNQAEHDLIEYIAERYGLDNRIYYIAKKEFYSRFPKNGRCINCHSKIGLGADDLTKASQMAIALKYYGKPLEEVTPEERKEHSRLQAQKRRRENRDYIIQWNRDYHKRTQDHVIAYGKKYRKEHPEETKLYSKKKYYQRKAEAKEVFGFFNYVPKGLSKCRAVSKREIKAGLLMFEPKREDYKQFFNPNFDWSKIA